MRLVRTLAAILASLAIMACPAAAQEAPPAFAEHIGPEFWRGCVSGDPAAGFVGARLEGWTAAEKSRDFVEYAAMAHTIVLLGNQSEPQTAEEATRAIEQFLQLMPKRTREFRDAWGKGETGLFMGPREWQAAEVTLSHGMGGARFCIFFNFILPHLGDDDPTDALAAEFQMFPRIRHPLATFWAVNSGNIDIGDNRGHAQALFMRPNLNLLEHAPAAVIVLSQQWIDTKQ